MSNGLRAGKTPRGTEEEVNSLTSDRQMKGENSFTLRGRSCAQEAGFTQWFIRRKRKAWGSFILQFDLVTLMGRALKWEIQYGLYQMLGIWTCFLNIFYLYQYYYKLYGRSTGEKHLLIFQYFNFKYHSKNTCSERHNTSSREVKWSLLIIYIKIGLEART